MIIATHFRGSAVITQLDPVTEVLGENKKFDKFWAVTGKYNRLNPSVIGNLVNKTNRGIAGSRQVPVRMEEEKSLKKYLISSNPNNYFYFKGITSKDQGTSCHLTTFIDDINN